VNEQTLWQRSAALGPTRVLEMGVALAPGVDLLDTRWRPIGRACQVSGSALRPVGMARPVTGQRIITRELSGSSAKSISPFDGHPDYRSQGLATSLGCSVRRFAYLLPVLGAEALGQARCEMFWPVREQCLAAVRVASSAVAVIASLSRSQRL
jgi:hypothetical protein